MARRRTRTPSPGATPAGRNGFNNANGQLATFTDNLRAANRESGDAWRLEQQRNRQRREEGQAGVITGLMEYRLRSMVANTGLFTMGAGIGAFNDVLRYGGGGDTASASFTNSMANFAAQNMDLGGVFSRQMDPLNRAAQSTLDFTSMIARVGGNVDPMMRRQLMEANIAMERRVKAEEEAMGKEVLYQSDTALTSTFGRWMASARKSRDDYSIGAVFRDAWTNIWSR